MVQADEIRVDFTLNAKDFELGMQRAGREMEKLQNKAAKMERKFQETFDRLKKSWSELQIVMDDSASTADKAEAAFRGVGLVAGRTAGAIAGMGVVVADTMDKISTSFKEMEGVRRELAEGYFTEQGMKDIEDVSTNIAQIKEDLDAIKKAPVDRIGGSFTRALSGFPEYGARMTGVAVGREGAGEPDVFGALTGGVMGALAQGAMRGIIGERRRLEQPVEVMAKEMNQRIGQQLRSDRATFNYLRGGAGTQLGRGVATAQQVLSGAGLALPSLADVQSAIAQNLRNSTVDGMRKQADTLARQYGETRDSIPRRKDIQSQEQLEAARKLSEAAEEQRKAAREWARRAEELEDSPPVTLWEIPQ